MLPWWGREMSSWLYLKGLKLSPLWQSLCNRVCKSECRILYICLMNWGNWVATALLKPGTIIQHGFSPRYLFSLYPHSIYSPRWQKIAPKMTQGFWINLPGFERIHCLLYYSFGVDLWKGKQTIGYWTLKPRWNSLFFALALLRGFCVTLRSSNAFWNGPFYFFGYLLTLTPAGYLREKVGFGNYSDETDQQRLSLWKDGLPIICSCWGWGKY